MGGGGAAFARRGPTRTFVQLGRIDFCVGTTPLLRFVTTHVGTPRREARPPQGAPAAAARHHRVPAHGVAALRRAREVHRRARRGDGADKEIFLAAQKTRRPTSRRPRTSTRSARSARSCSCSGCPTAPSRCWSRASGARASSASSQTDGLLPGRGRGDPRRARPHDVEVEALIRSVQSTFEIYVKLNKKVQPEVLMSVQSIDDPRQLADTIVAQPATIKLADARGCSRWTTPRSGSSASTS